MFDFYIQFIWLFTNLKIHLVRSHHTSHGLSPNVHYSYQWVSDITYIYTMDERFCYLLLVTDAFLAHDWCVNSIIIIIACKGTTKFADLQIFGEKV